jgi:hypothetical protein
MNKKLLQTLSVLMLLLPFGAAHAGEEGFYVGGSFGQSAMELPSDPELIFDEKDSAWKVFGGYNFDLGSVNLGIEAAYANLGNPEIGDATAYVGFETLGFEAFGVAALEVGSFDLFAKLGLIAWDVEGIIGGDQVPPEFLFAESENGTDVAYGFGARWNLGKIGLRAEFEGFDIPDTNTVYMWSVGVSYAF